MVSQLTTWLLLFWAKICGAHEALAGSDHGVGGPLLGNLIVAGAAGLVTVCCFAIAMRMLLRPEEHDPTHPKYRILSDDR